MDNILKICPVCGFDQLDETPYSDNIGSNPSHEVCPCCEFEFGYDDSNLNKTFEEYRIDWIKNGFVFFDKDYEPKIWSLDVLKTQLNNINKVNYIPRIFKK
jgi:hypothetical protein